MSNERALVTGAAGFIGSHLTAALLKQGWSVVAIDNFDPSYARSLKKRNLRDISHQRLQFHEVDIRDAEAIERLVHRDKPDVIFHFAALAGVRPSLAAASDFADVNVCGLIHVLEAARRASCPRFVFASSSSVYGNSSSVPFKESDPADRPISPYAATKRAGELIASAFADLYDLNIACLRLFTVYGPRQRPDLAIATFMSAISRGEPAPVFGDGSSSRDYTFVDDIVQGVIAAARRIGSPDIGRFRVWNLGSAAPISLADMIDAVAEVVGRTPLLDRKSQQPGDVRITFADLARSEAELGYRPQTPFRDGLRRQWEWYCQFEQASLP